METTANAREEQHRHDKREEGEESKIARVRGNRFGLHSTLVKIACLIGFDS